MKACGITAEYNPFHNGHRHQITEARKQTGCDVMVAVMAGNFTQRGEPAVIGKRARAEAAVRNGIDIVFELPYLFSVQSATHFAAGAVRLLELAGVSWISFGSECGNLENLKEIAGTPVNPDHLHASLDAGMSFPKAYSLLAGEMMPNDILAVAYLKAMKDTGIEPVLVQRTTSYHDETLREVSSAAAVRRALKEGRDPGSTTVMREELTGSFIPWPELYYPYLRTFLIMTPKEVLSSYFLFSEGIENHLREKAELSPDYDSFLNACITHRYTAGRIRRTCLQALCQVTKREAGRLPEADTLRVLAFNETGREYLKQLRRQDVRIASRFAEVPKPWRFLEYRTTKMYASVFPEAQRKRLLEEEIAGAKLINI